MEKHELMICVYFRDFERLPWHVQRRRRVSVLSDPFSDEDLPKVQVKFGHPETETENEDHFEKTVKKKTRRKRYFFLRIDDIITKFNITAQNLKKTTKKFKAGITSQV